jgi:hypothetical protein
LSCFTETTSKARGLVGAEVGVWARAGVRRVAARRSAAEARGFIGVILRVESKGKGARVLDGMNEDGSRRVEKYFADCT